MRLALSITLILGLGCSGVGPSPVVERTGVVALIRSTEPSYRYTLHTGVLDPFPLDEAEVEPLLAGPHYFRGGRLFDADGKFFRQSDNASQVLSTDGRLAWTELTPHGARLQNELWVGPMGDPDAATQLSHGGSLLSWIDGGRLCYRDSNSLTELGDTLWCEPVDAPVDRSLVYRSESADIGATTWRSDGAVAFIKGSEVWMVEPGSGSPERLVDLQPLIPTWPLEWAPDGTQLAIGLRTADPDTRGFGLVDLSTGAWSERSPPTVGGVILLDWSPDSQALAGVVAADCWSDPLAMKRRCKHDLFLFERDQEPVRLTRRGWADLPVPVWL